VFFFFFHMKINININSLTFTVKFPVFLNTQDIRKKFLTAVNLIDVRYRTIGWL